MGTVVLLEVEEEGQRSIVGGEIAIPLKLAPKGTFCFFPEMPKDWSEDSGFLG